MDAEAIVTVSAAVVALTQLVKWIGLPDRWGAVVVLGLAAVGVGIWAYDNPQALTSLFPLFAGWVAVATAAAGIFGFTRASVDAVTRATSPPSGAGQHRTTKKHT